MNKLFKNTAGFITGALSPINQEGYDIESEKSNELNPKSRREIIKLTIGPILSPSEIYRYLPLRYSFFYQGDKKLLLGYNKGIFPHGKGKLYREDDIDRLIQRGLRFPYYDGSWEYGFPSEGTLYQSNHNFIGKFKRKSWKKAEGKNEYDDGSIYNGTF